MPFKKSISKTAFRKTTEEFYGKNNLGTETEFLGRMLSKMSANKENNISVVISDIDSMDIGRCKRQDTQLARMFDSANMVLIFQSLTTNTKRIQCTLLKAI